LVAIKKALILTKKVELLERINFPSKAENINLAEKLIDELCEKHNVHEDHYGNILIAITEAVNNAIHHGNKLDPEKSVTLGYSVDGDKLSVLIADEGPGFDFENLPDPTEPENIEKPHGRGVFLMKALADEVQFEQNGAEVEMVFDLSKKAE